MHQVDNSAAIEGWCKGDMHIAMSPRQSGALSSTVLVPITPTIDFILQHCVRELLHYALMYTDGFRKDQRHADSQARTLRHMVVHESQVLMDRQTTRLGKHAQMNRK